MTKKVYRTANGKTVDIGALMLQNENVRAVGNMNVNARGDVVAPSGVATESRSQTVAADIQTVTKQPTKRAVPTSRRNLNVPEVEESPIAQMFAASPVDIDQKPAHEQVSELSGIAAALARTKLVQQEELTPVSKQQRSKTGVSKI